MISISSGAPAALLILKQADAAAFAFDEETLTATDKISAIVNGVSAQDSAAKTQASSAINKALLDAREADDAVVSHALAFLESDSFKSSDPGVTAALKRLIEEDGAGFAALVKAEKAKHPGISADNAMANAVQAFVRNNRDRFMDDEFVIGFKLANGASILANIEDINGNSISNTLDKQRAANMKEFSVALGGFLETVKVPERSARAEYDRMNAALTAVLAGAAESASWSEKWWDAFGFR